ncbi:hypothetical protein [Dokdonia sp. Hel_I_53]|uniref:hypothetical protein n=1 Tax=Dokdonia sp. Hel_I_53 TaxID=1566287 RepID=UPI00119B5E44|nr:hypothetical protein [Dokdonia sp. Hel_I_53]TVZ52820.1 nitrite reductase/ring-hydroxylating ferredoxin subunit [Dokdonia sp. Hel_I_53]
MRTFCLLTIVILLTSSCSTTDDDNQRNPFLLDINFSTQLGPIQVLDLEIPSSPIYVANGGIRGFFVINTGSGIIAWEASDPNHAPNDCSQMTIDGINVVCACEEHNYNLFTGQSNGEVLQYTLLPYRVSISGSTITVFN